MCRKHLLVFVLLALSAGCLPGDDEQSTYENFVERAEAAEEEGWTPFWLGRSFQAGSLTFFGPGVADFGAEVSGGGVNYTYAARGQSPFAKLQVIVYSAAAWEEARPIHDFNGTRVSLKGHTARCASIGGGSREVDQLRCIVELSGSIVTAIAPSLNADRPGSPDQNPLLDTELLLSVLEQLRPYPD